MPKVDNPGFYEPILEFEVLEDMTSLSKYRKALDKFMEKEDNFSIRTVRKILITGVVEKSRNY